jgi:hypothetical protein
MREISNFMAHKNKVIRSINLDGEMICVDVFQREDGTFGFDEFRRDPEDTRGWFSIGHFDGFVFNSYESALKDARKTIPWLDRKLHHK